MSLPGLAAVTEHAGLARSEQGNRVLAGSVGHWHSDGHKRVWVKGTVEGCNDGMGDLSDADLLAKIAEADEALDPAPEFGTGLHEALERVSAQFVSAKPQRGGKRTCRDIDCHHSESRHNASGQCRTCGCTDFRVPADA